jgi:hypothetical protein
VARARAGGHWAGRFSRGGERRQWRCQTKCEAVDIFMRDGSRRLVAPVNFCLTGSQLEK